jgi:predicted 3-demethylubiquinone-9 3-methyltransferase (glyoxalase superfamily)
MIHGFDMASLPQHSGIETPRRANGNGGAPVGHSPATAGQTRLAFNQLVIYIVSNNKEETPMPAVSFSRNKITPFLWFDGKAEEAARFYAGLFEGSKIVSASPMMCEFELAGQSFLALNGGPHFSFTEAVSFYVSCEDQAEVDRLWHALTADGGAESQCGWLKDKYGLSWQIIPEALPRYMSDPDRPKAERVMQTMMKMRKIIVADLDAAAAV